MNYCATYLGPEGFGAYEVTWSGPVPELVRVNRSPDRLLIPGFVDVHFHGAYGIDFMSASKEQMVELADKVLREGYEAFLPTTVTASFADATGAVVNLPDHPMMPGFHLEGPFISPYYPGAQPREAISDPPVGPSEWDALLEHPKLRYVTLAPERPHALELSSRLMQRRVIVSMGHSNATYEEARRGYEFGAAHTTHTYNAMRPFHHREVGLAGYALINSDVRCELIYDRLHVGKEAAALLFKCKPEDGVIAVSDSTAATRLAPGVRFTMWGHECVVGRGDVRLADGILAGSAVTLLDTFRNLAEDFGEETATRACSLNPRRALRMTAPPRVFVEFDKSLQIQGIRVDGKQIDL